MSTASLLLAALLLVPVLFAQASSTAPPKAAEPPDANSRLVTMRRICVDKFAGDEGLVATVREIAIASLYSLKRFTVTEKCDKADAALKGAVIERTDKRVRAEGEAAEFGTAAGAVTGNRQSATGAFGAAMGGSGENLLSAETGSRASVTLRLVDAEGDVLWAYTQDSTGGKSKGAVSDAVDRAIKQLSRDIARTEPGTK